MLNGTGYPLGQSRFLSGKKIIFTLLIIHCSLLIANAQWIKQYSLNPNNSGTLYGIQFLNNNTGYVVGAEQTFGNGIVLKTTNGGINWTYFIVTDSIYNVSNLYNLCFLDANTGFVCGYSYKIYKTTNGGINWIGIPAPIYGNQTYWAIKFFNEMTGFIGGRYGMMYKTTNGGTNWLSYDTAYSYINDVWFFNLNTGFKCDGYSGIYKTINSGINWTYKILTDSLGFGGGNMESVDFKDEYTGYVTGSRALFKTTDAGNNWKSVFISNNINLWSVKAVNNNVYVGSDSNFILFSSNEGISWNRQSLNSTYNFVHSICFTDNNTGYLTSRYDIYKTTNGGVFVNEISTEVPVKFSLFQNYPNPFNPSTKIKFDISGEVKRKTLDVKLTVYNMLGKEVASLVNEQLQPGTYEVTFDARQNGLGSNLSSGLYFYKLIAGNFVETKKMLMIK